MMSDTIFDCGNQLMEIFQDGESSVSFKEEMSKMSDCEVVLQEEDSISFDDPSGGGIEATDIGSLLEQFIEYEQESEVDANSYSNSAFITPCGSPSESDDVVLDRLMIVQEKLSQGVIDEPVKCSSIIEEEIEVVDDADPKESVQLKHPLKGLHRTVNGVHPKGNHIRMADSPKFAKFKRKRANNIPPLRRCVSGTNTPRASSPSDVVSSEEKKRREVKLIEALALPFPNSQKKKASLDSKKSNETECLKRSAEPDEPLSSRMMPVVSKRAKLNKNNNNNNNNNNVIDDSLDPRLKKQRYGERSNITNLVDTNLKARDPPKNRLTSCDNERAIVDMTIDHDAIAGTIYTVVDTNNDSSSDKAVTSNQTEVVVKIEVVEEPSTFEENSNQLIKSGSDNIINNINIKSENNLVVNSKNLTFKTNNFKSKQPKNYRRPNNLVDDEELPTYSTSESTDDDDDVSYKRKGKERNSPSENRNYYRSSSSPVSRRSRSKKHSTSVSPSYSRERSRSPLYRSDLYGPSRAKSSHSNSEEEDSDIKEKLIELSNPVPYDIEHERKVRFLVGDNSSGSVERRNIYVGGIKRYTTKAELADRFQRFGHIEKITLHFRQKGDNYAFIVYEEPEDAMRAIEEGNDDSNYPSLELCFGGRRKFVGGSYVDFDGNNRYLEESDMALQQTRCESPENDFDQLLKLAMKSTTTKVKEQSPEWT